MTRSVIQRRPAAEVTSPGAESERPPSLLERVTRTVTVFRVVTIAAAVFVGLLAAYPLAKMFVDLVVGDTGDTGSVTGSELFTLVWHTLLVVTVSGFLALVLGTLLAWLNVKTDVRMGAIADVLPMVPFLLPPVAAAVGWVLLISPEAGFLNYWIRGAAGAVGLTIETGPFDIHTWYALFFLYTIYHVPYVYLLVSAALLNMDSSLEEQSKVCGAGVLRTLWRVTIPSVRPALGGSLILLVWTGIGMYSVPAILTAGGNIQILSVRVVQLLRDFPPDTRAALSLSMIMITLVGITWFIQRRLLRGGQFAKIAGKGARAQPIRMGRWRTPLRVIISAYLLITTILPVVALVLVAFRGFWTPRLTWSSLNLTAVRDALSNDGISRSLQNSLFLGVTGATVGILLAASLSLLFLRSRSRLFRTLDGAIRIPAILPHVVVAVGFILAFAGPPFSLGGTLLILFLAFIVVWMPQGLIASDAAVSQVGAELDEASRVSGASEGRTFVRIYLPLIRAGLIAGWVLLFVRMVGDLNVAALLSGTNTPVVGSQILSVYENSSYADLSVLALVLTCITGFAVSLTLITGQRRAVRQLGN